MAFEIQQPIEPGPVNAGIAAQPLVTSAAPVVTPDAVSALVDSVRNGSISAREIIDHVGSVAQAERKATLQKLGEFVSPEAIEARHQIEIAGGVQAQTAAAQAQSNLRLLPKLEGLAATKADIEAAEQKHGVGSYNAFTAYAPTYGYDVSTIKNADEAAAYGAEILFNQHQIETARAGTLPSGKQVDVQTPEGRFVKVEANALGQALYDWKGGLSAAHKDWLKKYEEAIDRRDKTIAKNEQEAAKRKATAPASMPVINIHLPPQTPPPSPMIDTTLAPPVATAAPVASRFQSGFERSPLDTTAPKEESEAREIVSKSAPVQEFASIIPALKDFYSRVSENAELDKSPGASRLMSDKALGRAVFNLFKGTSGGPGGGGGRAMAGEFKGAEFENLNSWPERIKHFAPLVLRKGTLTPETRKMLIAEGESYANDIAEALKADTGIDTASNVVLGSQGRANPDNVFGSRGNWLREAAEGGDVLGAIRKTVPVVATTDASAPTVTVPGRGKGQYLGDGWFKPATPVVSKR